MNPYMTSRLARDREEDLRRRAEIYRLLAEVCMPEPRWRKGLAALARRSASLLRLVSRRGAASPARLTPPTARCRTI